MLSNMCPKRTSILAMDVSLSHLAVFLRLNGSTLVSPAGKRFDLAKAALQSKGDSYGLSFYH